MGRRVSTHSSNSGHWLYGLHPVRAALANRRRKLHRAVLTERAAEAIGPSLLARVRHELLSGDAVARLVPAGATHQGVALLCEPLSGIDLEEALNTTLGGRRIVAVLDQVTDPHNVGAILRSAAALGMTAVIVQDRHAPHQSGTLAKAASGALDLLPYIEVVNIARVLERLRQLGFWRIALTGDAEQTIAQASASGDVALVLGSEGAGIRRLVREHCDAEGRIFVRPEVDSLNVSAAAAIAFYVLREKEEG